MADTFGANNATMLVSLSQIAEALCILLIPFFLKRYGIKVVMLIAMFAWVLRFGFFGAGNPAFPGVILIVLSCLVYGVAFDFFNVSGGIFVTCSSWARLPSVHSTAPRPSTGATRFTWPLSNPLLPTRVCPNRCATTMPSN